ncbi:hypothetical protein CEXT_702421 [Caerostris extrusa]|uniref:Uncharacterized protein n=1 Tax=Caerostris extrusa TaxID=172846 RepID=A0AAV4N1A2_CAEEX|nr:hypothetical protein CEXT_702421 [Caerostris extrusa]
MGRGGNPPKPGKRVTFLLCRSSFQMHFFRPRVIGRRKPDIIILLDAAMGDPVRDTVCGLGCEAGLTATGAIIDVVWQQREDLWMFLIFGFVVVLSDGIMEPVYLEDIWNTLEDLETLKKAKGIVWNEIQLKITNF